MPLLVMKFGGTSVADLDRIANAAAKVQREVERGYDVIVIVSAMSGKTNELVGWVEDTGIDGFNLSRTVVPECIDDVVDLLVPALQERGAYKTAYADGTYRDKLFGRARLPASHAAAQCRST